MTGLDTTVYNILPFYSCHWHLDSANYSVHVWFKSIYLNGAHSFGLCV